jgi:hypothetical protein
MSSKRKYIVKIIILQLLYIKNIINLFGTPVLWISSTFSGMAYYVILNILLFFK